MLIIKALRSEALSGEPGRGWASFVPGIQEGKHPVRSTQRFSSMKAHILALLELLSEIWLQGKVMHTTECVSGKKCEMSCSRGIMKVFSHNIITAAGETVRKAKEGTGR